MILEKYQREQLQNILSSPHFKAVEYFLMELSKEIGIAPILNVTEWDHTKGSLQKEYQIAILQQLPSLMEQAAADGGENA